MTTIIKVQDKFLIGEGGKHKDVFRLKFPFEMTKSDEGIQIKPYDVDMIDTIIPYIDFDEFEYQVQPTKGFADFYMEASQKYIQELQERDE
jgi:hypothetical protein